MLSRKVLSLVASLLVLAAASPAAAGRLQLGDEAFIDVRALIQAWGQGAEDSSPNKKDFGVDFYLRRARLMLSGNATKDLSFFIDTDSPNFGKGGNFGANIYIQDAFASYRIIPELTVDAGLIILPLSHQSLQGAVSLNTLDYHAFLFKYPADSNKVWRDTGFQARGLLVGDRIQYRLGVFGGVRGAVGRVDSAGKPLGDLNPSGHPRVTGSVRYNFLDAEPDFFFAGTYLGKKKVLSIGIGGDYQSKAVGTGTWVSDNIALSGDVFFDYPLDDNNEIVAQVNVIHYRHGSKAPSTGTGVFGELGYRRGKIEPVVGFDYFSSARGDQDLQGFHLGGNYWISGHAANVKADLAFVKDAAFRKVAGLDNASNQTVFTLQTQFFF